MLMMIMITNNFNLMHVGLWWDEDKWWMWADRCGVAGWCGRPIWTTWRCRATLTVPTNVPRVHLFIGCSNHLCSDLGALLPPPSLRAGAYLLLHTPHTFFFFCNMGVHAQMDLELYLFLYKKNVVIGIGDAIFFNYSCLPPFHKE